MQSVVVLLHITRGPAIAEEPRVSGTLHWRLSKWIIFRMWVPVENCFAVGEHQSALMSKITNDVLTRSGTWCFIAVPIWQQLASKG